MLRGSIPGTDDGGWRRKALLAPNISARCRVVDTTRVELIVDDEDSDEV